MINIIIIMLTTLPSLSQNNNLPQYGCQMDQCLQCDERKIGCLKCDDGYYNTLLGHCYQCSVQCKTCSIKPANCTSCDTTKTNRYFDSATFDCVCSTGYYQQGLNCNKCQNNCLKCSSSSLCLQCDKNKFYQIKNNTCSCIDGYANNTTSLLCQRCSVLCTTCIQPNNQFNCTSCIDGYYVEPSNTNPQALDPGPCKKCPSQCSTCKNATFCTSCKIQSNFYLQNNLCVCPLTYYMDEIKISSTTDPQLKTKYCRKCHVHCLQCIDMKEENCTSCINLFHRTLIIVDMTAGTGRCDCIPGFYQQQDQCKSCPQFCDQCNNKSSCISCIKEYILQTQANNDVHCVFCQFTCKTCQTQKDNCTSCYQQQFRKLDNNNCICIDGYYNDIQLCSKCNQTCETCTDIDHCTKCFEGNFLNISGTMDTCQPCHYSCNTCNSEDITKCTSCNTQKHRYFRSTSTQGQCLCVSGYFQSNQQCTQCHYSCAQCNGITVAQCILCNNQHFRMFNASTTNTSIGSCICINNYFQKGDKSCFQCGYTCKTCVEESKCLQCGQENFRVIDINNHCVCLLGYYDDKITTCLKCFERCQTCESSIKCFTCKEGNYLDNFECKKCHYSCKTCQTNSTENNCITCPQNRIKGVNSCYCQIRYYDAGIPLCLRCEPFCLRCSQISNNCTQCQQGFLQDPKGNQCPKCHILCKACIGVRDNCTKCVNNMMFIKDQKCYCPKGYFIRHIQCIRCHYSCSQCEGLYNFQCIKNCNTDITNRKNMTLSRNDVFRCQCQDGYFDDDINLICPPCAPICKTCKHQNTTCYSCNTGKFLYFTNCLDKCPFEYYGDVSDNTCKNCIPGCRRCSNGVSCDQCNPGKLSYSSSCIDVCPFPFKTYKTNECINCTSQALFIDGERCVQSCKSNEYALKPNYICTICQGQCNHLIYSINSFFQRDNQLFLVVKFNQVIKQKQLQPNLFEASLGNQQLLIQSVFYQQDQLVFNLKLVGVVSELTSLKLSITQFTNITGINNEDLSVNGLNTTLVQTKQINQELDQAQSLCMLSKLSAILLLILVLFGSIWVPAKKFRILLYFPASIYFFTFVQQEISFNNRLYFRCFDSIFFGLQDNLRNVFMSLAPQYYIQKSTYPFFLTTDDANFFRLAGASLLALAIMIALHLLIKYIFLKVLRMDCAKIFLRPVKLFGQILIINILLAGISQLRFIQINIPIFNQKKLQFFIASIIFSILGLITWILFFVKVSIKQSKKHRTFRSFKRIRQLIQIFYLNTYMLWLIIIAQHRNFLFTSAILNSLYLYVNRQNLTDISLLTHTVINTIVSFMILFEKQSRLVLGVVIIVLCQIGMIINLINAFVIIATHTSTVGFENIAQDQIDKNLSVQWNEQLGKYVRKGQNRNVNDEKTLIEEIKQRQRKKKQEIKERIKNNSKNKREIKRKEYKDTINDKYGKVNI